MKIFSPESLATTAGKFTLSSEIPSEMYPDTNVDGSRPSVSVDVDASTQLVALKVLDYLNDEGVEDLITAIVLQLFRADADFDDSTFDFEDEATLELLDQKMTELHSPFIDFDFNMDVRMEEDGKETVSNVKLVITAPSGAIAIESFIGLTGKKMLNRLATSFMPDEEDEDDYDY